MIRLRFLRRLYIDSGNKTNHSKTDHLEGMKRLRQFS